MGIQMDHGPDNQISIETARDCWLDDLADSSTELDREVHQNDSSIEIQPIYTPTDLEGSDYLNDLGFPGEFPFTRGIYPSMYRGRHWTMRQVSGLKSAEGTNERLLYLQSIGQTGLNVVFDLPTHRGYDPDHPMALGEVGKNGVPISCLEDMVALLRGIDLNKLSISVVESSSTAIIMAFFVAAIKQLGFQEEVVAGSIQNDVLKEYIGVGSSFIFPPKAGFKLAEDVIEYCTKNMPKFHLVTVNTHCTRENGTDAVQEAAIGLASAFAYLEGAIERGLEVNDVAGRISFHVSCDSDFFEDIAKIRAMRRIWANRLRYHYMATEERSWKLKCSVQTAGRTLTAQEADNNIVRTAFQALAGVLAGAQSIHTNSLDEPIGLPTERAVRIALRTQQIIAEETGVTNTIDPLGGSYYLECMTNEIESRTLRMISDIEEIGVIAGIENGWFREKIYSTDAKRAALTELGEKVVVGVNKYRLDTDVPTDVLIIDQGYEEEQVLRIIQFRDNRTNDTERSEMLETVRSAAIADTNIIESLIAAVEVGCTMGEMAEVLKDVYGEWDPGWKLA
jgi:methylmalonyl-CoA mutase N-terminal domain/subunit|tara:strand:- start:3048 stop:4739 length:1692 start_codon:yes stop_codon:yes gene_type:complete